jgi:hypothetical protein
MLSLYKGYDKMPDDKNNNYVNALEINGIEFFGAGTDKTILKFTDNSSSTQNHNYFSCAKLKNFKLSNFSIDGRDSYVGALYIDGGCQDGVVERINVYDSGHVSIVVGNRTGLETQNILVRDCLVKGQRQWTADSKAMFLAGDKVKFVTFENCRTYSKKYYSEGYSVADHFDSDDAQFIKYINCTTNGEGSVNGYGFWNEGEGYGKTSSSYYGCTAYKQKEG